MTNTALSATLPRPTRSKETARPWLWNVVLLDDDDHSYEYVIDLMTQIFGHKTEEGFSIAKRVDRDGRAVCFTTHREFAELKQEQIHAFGRDPRMQKCAGSMTAVLEPAEPGDDD